MLYCTLLCCAVLCCIVQYCTVLNCIVLYCTVLCCTLLYSTGTVRYGSQKIPIFMFFIKTVFLRVMETERLGHGRSVQQLIKRFVHFQRCLHVLPTKRFFFLNWSTCYFWYPACVRAVKLVATYLATRCLYGRP